MARHGDVWWWGSRNIINMLFGIPKIHHGKILYRKILLAFLLIVVLKVHEMYSIKFVQSVYSIVFDIVEEL